MHPIARVSLIARNARAAVWNPVHSRIVAGAILALALVAATIAQTTRPREVEIAAVGDILLDRGVGLRIRQYGAGYPFAKVAKYLQGADLSFGNLESPLARKCPDTEKKFSFRGVPEGARILGRAGIDVVSIANNHVPDCGEAGIHDTVASLDGFGVRAVGAAATDRSLRKPLIINVRGLRIGFLAFTAVAPIPDGVSPESGATVDPAEVAALVSELSSMADAVIVSFHWGDDYSPVPNEEQRRLAYSAAEAGADVVIGHHPHVLQAFEMLPPRGRGRKTLIAYSLGDFVFDSPSGLIPRTADSLILKFRLGKKGLVRAEAIPIVIERSRPRTANEVESSRSFSVLNRLSEAFETVIDDGRITTKTDTFRTRKVDLDLNGTSETVELDRSRPLTLSVRSGDGPRSFAVPADWNPWKLEFADVDGDGAIEIAVGVRKSTKFFPEPHNCLFIYRWSRLGLDPKWLGSALARPFTDFLFANLDENPGDELIALERTLAGRMSVAVYRWDGFGFTKEAERGDWRSARLIGAGNGQVEVEADGLPLRIAVGN